MKTSSAKTGIGGGASSNSNAEHVECAKGAGVVAVDPGARVVLACYERLAAECPKTTGRIIIDDVLSWNSTRALPQKAFT